MKYPFLFLCICFLNAALAQKTTIGIFSNCQDIGNPKNKGSADYDEATQTYLIKGSGYPGDDSNEFNYLFNRTAGDFVITANFEFVGKGTALRRKVGLTIRESVDANAMQISATLHGDGLTTMQWRDVQDRYARVPEEVIAAPKSKYTILQLERLGSDIIMRAAHPGEPLQWIGSHKTDNFKDSVLIGLFISSQNADAVEQARVWNVRIDRPAGDGYNSRRDGWLGCRLETMNVVDGKRKVVFETPDRFEAPNWMPDGKHLLFNMGGSLYTIPVEGGAPAKVNTGFADRINNDHGISFNGKLLAISHNREGMPGGGSSVYVLPVEGGTPKLVTEFTPSYFHGWAPNNREVVYVATREDNPTYDIYRKSVDGGKEVALTNTGPGEHVDGCEYSPDGKYIYYNGSQSGSMQIWRMTPDGTLHEQLTFDEYNNWFPHISPDGKWMVYISFPPTIPVNAHPSYKRVTLKLMPVSGGAPRVIAYLYGGQGTINVSSWSPDSKSIAFVSNSGK